MNGTFCLLCMLFNSSGASHDPPLSSACGKICFSLKGNDYDLLERVGRIFNVKCDIILSVDDSRTWPRN